MYRWVVISNTAHILFCMQIPLQQLLSSPTQFSLSHCQQVSFIDTRYKPIRNVLLDIKPGFAILIVKTNISKSIIIICIEAMEQVGWTYPFCAAVVQWRNKPWNDIIIEPASYQSAPWQSSSHFCVRSSPKYVATIFDVDCEGDETSAVWLPLINSPYCQDYAWISCAGFQRRIQRRCQWCKE